MTARWMCITALGAGLALGACDRGKSPSAGADPEPAEAPKAGAPTAEPPAEAPTEPPAPTEPAKVEEVEPGKAPEPPAEDPAEPATGDDGAGADKQDKQDKQDKHDDEQDKQAADDTATAGGAKGACGGVGGLRCKKSQKCRYAAGAFAPPHPDAMGKCVDETYCDAPPDCAELMHVMTVGEWACEKHRCAWKTKGGSGPM